LCQVLRDTRRAQGRVRAGGVGPDGPAQLVSLQSRLGGEQAADLVAGQRNLVVLAREWRLFGGGGDGDGGAGEHGQGHPPMSGGPAAKGAVLQVKQVGQLIAAAFLGRSRHAVAVDHGQDLPVPPLPNSARTSGSAL
jgi:hypothetical protein